MALDHGTSRPRDEVYYVLSQDYALFMDINQDINLKIKDAFDKHEINFAFPTQTLHMENFPGQMSISPTYEQEDKLKPKMDKFFEDQNKKNSDKFEKE